MMLQLHRNTKYGELEFCGRLDTCISICFGGYSSHSISCIRSLPIQSYSPNLVVYHVNEKHSCSAIHTYTHGIIHKSSG